MAYIVMAAFVAGFVQSVTGFGAGIVIMMVLPYFYTLAQSSTANNSITLLLNLAIVLQFRKYINWKKIVWPSIIATVSSFISIQFYDFLPIRTMKMIFAAFMCILAIYFLAFKNVKLKDNVATMIVCSLLSGFGNGLFGIGGPPMVLYILAITDKKEEYIGSLQAVFLFNSIFVTALKWMHGYAGKELFVPILCGILSIIIGQKVGSLFLNKISSERMKKYIYILMAVTALVQLIQCL